MSPSSTGALASSALDGCDAETDGPRRDRPTAAPVPRLRGGSEGRGRVANILLQMLLGSRSPRAMSGRRGGWRPARAAYGESARVDSWNLPVTSGPGRYQCSRPRPLERNVVFESVRSVAQGERPRRGSLSGRAPRRACGRTHFRYSAPGGHG